MGIYTDLASGTVATGANAPGLDRASRHQLLNKAYTYDPSVGSEYAAQSAEIEIATHTGTVTDGTYTITVSIPRLGVQFTTASIAHDATAAQIETAIDTASPSVVGDGDLAVDEEGSAGLQDGAITITAEDTVANTPVFVTIDGSSLVGGDAGDVTYNAYGQVDRKAAQALWGLGVVEGPLHNSGEPVTGLAKPETSGQTRPRSGLVADLARVAAWEDGSDAILEAVYALYPEARQS